MFDKTTLPSSINHQTTTTQLLNVTLIKSLELAGGILPFLIGSVIRRDYVRRELCGLKGVI